MDIVIEFFRDTLDGPFYIVWVVVLVILIFACIGYLAEKGIKNKKEKEKYATVDDTNNTAVVQDTVVSDVSNATQVESSPVTPIAEPASSVNNTDAVQNNVVSEPEVQTVNSSVVTPTVSEVTTSVNPNNTATVEAPQVEVSQPNNVVTPTVVNPQIEQTTNNNTVSADNVNAPSSEVSQVVIPTINQDGNNNTV